ncbi:MAG: flagellar basal-body rod protein FlgF [Weizmannia coagulans]|jgi:flagellar hook protein FlgE|uniref:Flagellar basal body rod protein FlgG n=1 Tax=Heyndrickxia faecalis TaxID=2824910 RepID=A0AAU7WFT8_9BACI|nr:MULTISPECIES: flagellar basal body rod protein FlgG [Heyndrickxia]AVD55856.1 flagellar basal-body rod protein FlgF [Heyndrickxia coagulans]AWP36751.1 flagellar basal-body rod protein FlgF [Heyndrickxia coagulans]MCI1575921.1 flagellar basal-body rod protein FlgF [Heyndrickxia coagulans]MED4839633.1 flagellar basal body rod protein FlgG [Weizmannia sp. CD-2023]MED4902044.1 flagellar basal body rod protein FlgG [Weizmannia sp. CD-2023]
MLRSLYSGVSGMKNFQTELDTIGNNIANVNTYGYKKGRVTFKDAISQTLASATPGTSAQQVGLGSQIGSIDTVDTSGSPESTGRPLDFAITGDGYFRVADGNNTYYTRAGNFYFDNNRRLVNSEGFTVLGTNGQAITLGANVKSFSVATDGTITDQDGNTIGTISIATFQNPAGLTKVGGNLYTTTNSNAGTVTVSQPGQNGAGTIKSGYLEMSNVDLSEELTNMIVAERGFQANTRIITTSDEILQELVNLKR